MGIAAAVTAGATALGVGAATAGVIGAGVALGAGVLGATVLSSALTPKTPTPAAPSASPAPAVAPTMDQTAILNAQKQQAVLASATSGRQSTILSQAMGSSGSDKLG